MNEWSDELPHRTTIPHTPVCACMGRRRFRMNGRPVPQFPSCNLANRGGTMITTRLLRVNELNALTAAATSAAAQQR